MIIFCNTVDINDIVNIYIYMGRKDIYVYINV